MKSVLAIVALLASTSVAAECELPQAPTIPDGSTQELAAMVEGQKAVKAYMKSSEEYLSCLDSAGMNATGDETEEQAAERESRVDAYNAEVDTQHAIAGDWSRELKEYKEKNK
jgi:hypothetical protein